MPSSTRPADNVHNQVFKPEDIFNHSISWYTARPLECPLYHHTTANQVGRQSRRTTPDSYRDPRDSVTLVPPPDLRSPIPSTLPKANLLYDNLRHCYIYMANSFATAPSQLKLRKPTNLLHLYGAFPDYSTMPSQLHDETS